MSGMCIVILYINFVTLRTVLTLKKTFSTVLLLYNTNSVVFI